MVSKYSNNDPSLAFALTLSLALMVANNVNTRDSFSVDRETMAMPLMNVQYVPLIKHSLWFCSKGSVDMAIRTLTSQRKGKKVDVHHDDSEELDSEYLTYTSKGKVSTFFSVAQLFMSRSLT